MSPYRERDRGRGVEEKSGFRKMSGVEEREST